MSSHSHLDRPDLLSKMPLPMSMWEFVAIVAGLMSLNAFAIDTMLPALGLISDAYQLENPNDQQLVIYAYILGFGLPQLIYGPISDAYGRRGLLRICLIAYIVAGILCMLTNSFALLLLVRFLHGVVASGIRVIAVSIVRDVVVGRAMARIMSLVMTVFMIVPIIAPAIGQSVMSIYGWEWTFGVLSVFGVVMWIWIELRLPETLPEDKRNSLNFVSAFRSYAKVLSTRVTLGYVCASGVIFGALFAFIGASEQVFSDVFGRGDKFALWFAIIASVLAVVNFTNSFLVERFGMRRISHLVLILFIVFSIANIALMHLTNQNFVVFMILFALTFGCFGMLGANFSAIALEPQGKMAGTASAAYGFASTTFASIFGWMVASQYNETIIPLLVGYALLGLGSLIIVLFTERGSLFELGPSHQSKN